MLKKYIVEIAEVFEKLKYGFRLHKKAYVLIEESKSFKDINAKYPNASSIKKM